MKILYNYMSFLQRLYVHPLNAQWVHSERKVNASKQNFVSASKQWANTEPKRECKAKFNGDRTHDKQYVKEDEQFIRIALRIILTLFFVSNQEKLKNKLIIWLNLESNPGPYIYGQNLVLTLPLSVCIIPE